MAGVYQQQVTGPSVVPLAAQPGPDDAGVFGQGLAQLGQAAEAMAQDNRRTKQQVSQIDFETAKLAQERQRAATYDLSMGAFGELQVKTAALRQQQWDSLPGGKAGFASQYGQTVQEQAAQFLQGISDEHVRGQMTHMVNSWAVQERIGALHNETQAFAKFQGEAVQSALNLQANNVLINPDAQNYLQAVETWNTYAKGRFSDQAMQEHVRKTGEHQLTAALLDGLLNSGDSQSVIKLVKSGQFNEILTPDQMDQYIDNAEHVERRAAADAKTQLTLVQHAAREDYRSLKVDIENGATVPQSRITQVMESMKAAALPESELKEAAYLGRDNQNQNQIRNLATQVLDTRVLQLRAEQSANRISDDDRAWLDSAEKALTKRAEHDGLKLGPLLRGTTDQQFQAVQQLARLPLDERFRVAKAAGDERAAVVANLAPETQARALQGIELLKARRNDFMPPKSPTTSPEAALDAQAKAVLGNLTGDVGGHYAQVRDTALAVMAGFRAHSGWDAKQYESALQIVYGQNRRADGTVQGGIGTIRGRKVELPPHWSEAEWDKAYSRNPFTGAVNAMGDAISHGDIKANYTPRHIATQPDGTEEYWMMDASGKQLLQKHDGKLVPYLLRVPVRP